MKNHTVQLVVMLVIGIAIGVIGANLAGQGGEELRDSSSNVAETESTPADMPSENTKTTDTSSAPQEVELPGIDRVPKNSRPGLTVLDQPAGAQVAVSGLTFDSPAWVAVYDNRGGKPGWILGAKRFLPGDVAGIVPLLRATVSGETYYAVIHGDDGDLTFDKRKDPAPAPDSALIVSFRAQ